MDVVEASPLTPPVDPRVPSLLRPEPLDRFAFVVDINVGKLALYLRTLGFDTVYDSDTRDFQLAAIAQTQKRILLTLSSRIKPLSRCIPCNGILVPVSKETILDRLEPLTRKYYESFQICRQCKRIYWPGSHQERILQKLEKLRA